MLLIGVREENGWLLSRWKLTYPAGWNHILKAAHAVYDYYHEQEILVNDQPCEVTGKENIMTINEDRSLTLRGVSDILNVPVMITFINQTNVVDVNVAAATEEFSKADYQKFNMSMGQYMDSIEIAMYR